MKIIYFFCLFIFLLLSACTKKSPDSSAHQLNPEELVQRGKSIYNLNCIACHNADPSKEGTTGPSVYGSSKELLEARIRHATYPVGYKAKRTTQLMPTMPHLEKEIIALHSFLSPSR